MTPSEVADSIGLYEAHLILDRDEARQNREVARLGRILPSAVAAGFGSDEAAAALTRMLRKLESDG